MKVAPPTSLYLFKVPVCGLKGGRENPPEGMDAVVLHLPVLLLQEAKKLHKDLACIIARRIEK